MKSGAAALAAFACALAFASSTAASSRKAYVLKLNDSFLVSGSDIGCEAIIGKKLLRGQKLLACYKLKASAPVTKSYAAALAADGRIAIARANTDGTGTIVFGRKPASLHSRSKTITVKPGDQIVLGGTDLACAISTGAKTGPYASCFRIATKGGRPNSYGFAETTAFTSVLQFDATGLKSKIVFTRRHGA